MMSDEMMGRDGQPPAAALVASLALHPAQARFVAATERFSFYVGGVGAGLVVGAFALAHRMRRTPQ